jgi:hypothetical protein
MCGVTELSKVVVGGIFLEISCFRTKGESLCVRALVLCPERELREIRRVDFSDYIKYVTKIEQF